MDRGVWWATAGHNSSEHTLDKHVADTGANTTLPSPPPHPSNTLLGF